ncbi:hypothetical protein BC833DRAFT_598634 [Globomyces pollinis-pini]|nr:hypothetical protein BC833DRAFT_598634 [Globomyces pollinis-pini]
MYESSMKVIFLPVGVIYKCYVFVLLESSKYMYSQSLSQSRNYCYALYALLVSYLVLYE